MLEAHIFFFNPCQVFQIAEGESHLHAKSLDGTDFVPGCLGLNQIKESDYLNVIVQLICQIIPLRNYLLLYEAPVQVLFVGFLCRHAR